MKALSDHTIPELKVLLKRLGYDKPVSGLRKEQLISRVRYLKDKKKGGARRKVKLVKRKRRGGGVIGGGLVGGGVTGGRRRLRLVM